MRGARASVWECRGRKVEVVFRGPSGRRGSEGPCNERGPCLAISNTLKGAVRLSAACFFLLAQAPARQQYERPSLGIHGNDELSSFLLQYYRCSDRPVSHKDPSVTTHHLPGPTSRSQDRRERLGSTLDHAGLMIGSRY